MSKVFEYPPYLVTENWNSDRFSTVRKARKRGNYESKIIIDGEM